MGSDGIATINICIPLLMLFTGVGLMVGAGCSVVASVQLSRGKNKSARLNVTQALFFVTVVALVPSVLMMLFPEKTARMLGSSAYLLPKVRLFTVVCAVVGLSDMDNCVAVPYPVGWFS